MDAVTNQEKHWRGGVYDLVCAEPPHSSPSPHPPLPPPPSELMRGFLMLFLASRSWSAVRGRRRERRREAAGGGRRAAGRWRGGRKRGGGGGVVLHVRGVGKGGGSHADLSCSSINTKHPVVKALNRDQTAGNRRKRGAPCHLQPTGRYCFLWFRCYFYFCTAVLNYTSICIWKSKSVKREFRAIE